jgi:S-adenosylmethionine:tRNA ribosyltransferase-isomerase
MDAFSFSLSDYDYPLPDERIAQHPSPERGLSRLLVLDRNTGEFRHARFSQLRNFLPPGALLVANNSRVAAARLFGEQKEGGRKRELLLLTPPPLLERAAGRKARGAPEAEWREAEAEVLLKPGRNVRPGDDLAFGPRIRVEVREKKDFGRHRVGFRWQGDLRERLEEAGTVPLPPYIKRGRSPDDGERYQTVYARPDKAGSVAAPTAGLHFTPEMCAALRGAGFGWTEVTLYVGYGTFSPVREQDIRSHVMHPEYMEISASAAGEIRKAREEGRPVCAVGTTTVRALEGAALACGGELPEKGWQGWTDIFLRPGCAFRLVDGLITNFHLPRSSLLILVSALAGRENVLDAYASAVREKYGFFSYGDAMLIR